MAVTIFLPPSTVIRRAALKMSTLELMILTMRLKTLMMNYYDRYLSSYIHLVPDSYNTQHIT